MPSPSPANRQAAARRRSGSKPGSERVGSIPVSRTPTYKDGMEAQTPV
jgi:hypothetical protein